MIKLPLLNRILRRALASVQAGEIAKRTEVFSRSIRSLDSSAVARTAALCLRERWDCQNVIWLPKGALAAELVRFSNGRNQNKFMSSDIRDQTVAAVGLKGGDFAKRFIQWGDALPVREPSGSEPLIFARGLEVVDVLAPILSPDPARQDVTLGYLLWSGAPNWVASSETPLFRAQMAAFADRMDQALAHEAVRSLTFKDELTDLFNQRYLPVVLDEQVERARRSEKQDVGARYKFSVLFVDVDRFKSVNDLNGHLVGSQILIELSRVLRGTVRRSDFAFRYGGDEYVVVLPGADAAGAFVAAERIRRAAESAAFTLADVGTPIQVTVSIGVACFPEHAGSTQELLRIADEAMYVSKRESRNAVRLAS